MKKQDGYVLDVAYPPHYYKQLQPLWLSSQADFLGVRAPDVTEPYSYCELGCGVGVNLLVAAALNPKGQFVGVDFNQQHLVRARQAVDSIGLDNIRFVHASFSEFAQQCEQPDGQFDFIVSHGVWSWVSSRNQQDMLRIIGSGLRSHGVSYLHYMCHPGATYQAPVQKFLHELSQHLPHSSEDSIKIGVSLLEELVGARVFDNQGLTSRHLQEIKQFSPAFWAHEYLTDHWQPQHSADVHRRVAEAGVLYLGSANAFDNVDVALSVPKAVHGVLDKMPSPSLREMVKDLARNSRQRMDLFQKAPIALSSEQRIEHLGAIEFSLLPEAPGSAPDGLKFATPIGELSGSADIFSPLLQRLHRGTASFNELRETPAFSNDPALLLNSLQLLLWQGYVHPARRDPVPEPERINRLKRWLEENSLTLNLVPECATAVHPKRQLDSLA